VESGLKVFMICLVHSLSPPPPPSNFCLVLCEIFLLLVVVTVDGTLLTKSGTMTGGTSGGMEARSHKWDDKKIEGL